MPDTHLLDVATAATTLREKGEVCLGHETTAEDVRDVVALSTLAPRTVSVTYTTDDDGVHLTAP